VVTARISRDSRAPVSDRTRKCATVHPLTDPAAQLSRCGAAVCSGSAAVTRPG